MGVKLLGKIKIYDIAKKLNLTSKEVLEVAKRLKIDAKSHLSGIEEEEAKRIENEITKKESKKERKGTVNKEKMETKKEEKAPVIIRREVIITQEDEQIKKKETAKKEEKKNNVGFVERKQNKDYNIVYRNKPNKPMTVSELFGLKKEEPNKQEEKETAMEEKKIMGETKREENLKATTQDSRVQKADNRRVKQVKDNRINRDNPDNRTCLLYTSPSPRDCS